MTFNEFDDFMEGLFGLCKMVRDAKGVEYARNSEDRFANFKRTAADLRMSPMEVGYIHLRKHLDAIASYIENDGKVYSEEPIRGRFVDLINYAFLLAGMAADLELERTKNDAIVEASRPELMKSDALASLRKKAGA